jgi:hypothetical protein
MFNWRPIPRGFHLVRIGIGVLAGLLAAAQAASAQITTDAPTQSEVLKLPSAGQGAKLAEVVRRSSPTWKCSQARASLEKTFDDGMGGWLVQCEEGQDFWVMMPAEGGRASIAQSCILARAMAGLDCYANLRTIMPEHVAQCTQSPFPDRVISACTAIIQSGRIADKPAGLSIAYQSRGVAFLRYQQFDLGLSDLDRAITLSPGDANALYNRAVALERKGDLDQAVRDLDEVLRLKPDHASANFERGFSYLRKGDYDRAVDDFNESIRMNPNFAQAYRDRSEAFKRKGDLAKADADLKKATELDPGVQAPPPPSPAQAPAPPPAQAQGELSDADKQAAYCMQASFQYAQRFTRLTSLLRENLKTGEAMLNRPDLSAADKTQLNAQLKSLNNNIAANDATTKRWSENAPVFIDYLKRRGLLDRAKIHLIESISADAQRDEQAVADTYSSCLRLCKPNDPSCKNTCDSKSTTSDPSKRMLRCDQVVSSFK